MPFDLTREPALTLSQAAKLVPSYREGRPTHVSRLMRWIVNGVRADDGRVFKLEAMRLGGQWITSAAALQRFAEAMTHDPCLCTLPDPGLAPQVRRARFPRARRIGI